MAIGTKSGFGDVYSFTSKEWKHPIFVGDLSLPNGKEIYASVRVYNKAGLYTSISSDPVVVSYSPKLTVYDGPSKDVDADYQSDISMIRGHWKYSDPCHIVSSEWAIEDLLGNRIQDYIPIKGTSFYNDELVLTNGFTYFNIIRVIDALNRTRISRSDGIAIRIQPPHLGNVRDGIDEDQNYQESITELSANWYGFGEEMSKDPTQRIVKYEVSIGNDRRFEKTRSNVHYFIDVGRNTSWTFSHLNLTARIMKYYITVRAYSDAGSYQQASSNGIRVGFQNNIIPGSIEYKNAQSIQTYIDVGWSEFYSDYGIRHYEIAISSLRNFTFNHTISCETLKEEEDIFDILKPTSYGTNTFARIDNLTLLHNHAYYVTVVSRNEACFCFPVTGNSLVVDTTPPIKGRIFIENLENVGHILYFKSPTTLHVQWDSFVDVESGLGVATLSIYQPHTCNEKLLSASNLIATETMINQNQYTFYGLEFSPETPYFFVLNILNTAGLSTNVTSAPLYLDQSKPDIGTVKSGKIWHTSASIQSSDSELHGMIAVARSKSEYHCERYRIIPIDQWQSIPIQFSQECFDTKAETLYLQVRYDDAQQNMIKGGASLRFGEITEGEYSVRMTGCAGNMTVTNWAIASSLESIPQNYDRTEDKSDLTNSTNKNDLNSTQTESSLGVPGHSGFGIMVLGFKVNGLYKIRFWARDRYFVKSKWTSLDFSPFDQHVKYSMVLSKSAVASQFYWNVDFHISDKSVVQFNSLVLDNDMMMYALGFNKDDYYPPITDHFHPFFSEATFEDIKLPSDVLSDCEYGTGFFDEESGIKEIWVSVSENANTTDNEILYETFCMDCNVICPDMYKPGICPNDDLKPFQTIHIDIYNLTLQSASAFSNHSGSGNNTFEGLESPVYFINVKVVNFAGEYAIASSEAISIDTTPPAFSSIHCVDPDHSIDQPAKFQSPVSKVGAFWECEEDASQIEQYFLQVGSSYGESDILNRTSVKLKTKVIQGLNDTVLKPNETYYITVTAINTAKLESSVTCDITIDTKHPDVSTFTANSLGGGTLPDGPPNVSFMESSENVGVTWQPGGYNAEYYGKYVYT